MTVSRDEQRVDDNQDARPARDLTGLPHALQISRTRTRPSPPSDSRRPTPPPRLMSSWSQWRSHRRDIIASRSFCFSRTIVLAVRPYVESADARRVTKGEGIVAAARRRGDQATCADFSSGRVSVASRANAQRDRVQSVTGGYTSSRHHPIKIH